MFKLNAHMSVSFVWVHVCVCVHVIYMYVVCTEVVQSNFNTLYTNDHYSDRDTVSEFLQKFKLCSYTRQIWGIIPYWIYLLYKSMYRF